MELPRPILSMGGLSSPMPAARVRHLTQMFAIRNQYLCLCVANVVTRSPAGAAIGPSTESIKLGARSGTRPGHVEVLKSHHNLFHSVIGPAAHNTRCRSQAN